MRLLRTPRRFLVFGAGAATAYFLDPDSGPARRQKVLAQIRQLAPAPGSTGETDAAQPGTSDAGTGAPRVDLIVGVFGEGPDDLVPSDVDDPAMVDAGATPSA